MAASPPVSATLQKLIDGGLFDRLPVTFTAYFADRFREWHLLFPAEQNYFELLFGLIDRLPNDARTALFAGVREAEAKMRVDEKSWPRGEFTLGQVDFLNRSPYYPAWRQAISGVFSRIDPVIDEEIQRHGRPSLAIIISPADLPVGPDRMWQKIPGGQRVPLQLGDVPVDEFLPLLLHGEDRKGPSIAARHAEKRARSAYDTWVLETQQRLRGTAGNAVHMSYDALESCRKSLMDDVRNVVEVRKIRGPRQLGEALRAVKVASGDPSIDQNPRLSEFVRSILLNGNGTLLLNNTFVEWGTVQAVRRARPTLSVIAFGIRNKVKPFTNLLIFDDQETATPVPTQVDTLGSYVDLEIFYRYVWQEFEKYAQYRRNIAYLFVAEAMDEMLVLAPPDFPLLALKPPVSLPAVNQACCDWLGL